MSIFFVIKVTIEGNWMKFTYFSRVWVQLTIIQSCSRVTLRFGFCAYSSSFSCYFSFFFFFFWVGVVFQKLKPWKLGILLPIISRLFKIFFILKVTLPIVGKVTNERMSASLYSSINISSRSVVYFVAGVQHYKHCTVRYCHPKIKYGITTAKNHNNDTKTKQLVDLRDFKSKHELHRSGSNLDGFQKRSRLKDHCFFSPPTHIASHDFCYPEVESLCFL